MKGRARVLLAGLVAAQNVISLVGVIVFLPAEFPYLDTL